MNKYKTEWFDHGECRHITLELLAESEEQVRRLVDDRCAPEWRGLPYRSDKQPYEDSLKIKVLEDNINLPYVLREYR